MTNILKYVVIALVFAIFVVVIGQNLFSSPSSKTSEIFSGVEISESKSISDLDYIKNLGLMQGHLIAAKELLDGGTPDQAQYHLDHPIDELYGEIEPRLQKEKVNFRDSLEKLYDIAKYKPYNSQVNKIYNESIKKIQLAINNFFRDNRQRPEFAEPEFAENVLISILETASEEYEAAIGKNCKIIAPIEYQDSYGFVKYVKQELDDKESWASGDTKNKMSQGVQDILKAWSPGTPFDGTVSEPPDCSNVVSEVGSKPSVYPPEYPVMTAKRLSKKIEKISN